MVMTSGLYIYKSPILDLFVYLFTYLLPYILTYSLMYLFYPYGLLCTYVHLHGEQQWCLPLSVSTLFLSPSQKE